jgi:sugar lactone lactonase YvrE
MCDPTPKVDLDHRPSVSLLLYVTNSLAPQILQLKPGGKTLEVWVENKQLQPPSGIGLDGIAIGSDGDIYVNTFNGGDFFRVEVKDGKPGAVTKLETSRPLKLPDGLRLVSGKNFLMVEGSGSLDRVTVNGDKVSIATIKDGLKEPTAVAKVGGTAWVTKVSRRIFSTRRPMSTAPSVRNRASRCGE